MHFGKPSLFLALMLNVFFPVSHSPFDKDDQASTASTVSKAPTVNKRFSTYSPPDTPSLREQAFYVSVFFLTCSFECTFLLISLCYCIFNAFNK